MQLPAYSSSPPDRLPVIRRTMTDMDFTMPAGDGVGELLRTLAAAKPGGRFLELGTGLGLSLTWMVDGMDAASTVLSIDNHPAYIEYVSGLFADDDRVELVCCDGADWLEHYRGPGFDLVFADTWPGKYDHLEEALGLLHPGGWYVIDDMLPQDNWPQGHAAKAASLSEALAARSDLHLCPISWSTGLILAVKRPA